MPLNIGLVTGEYPPMEGGVGAFTQELGQALFALGHQVHIITDRLARPAMHQSRWRELTEPVDIGFAQLHASVRNWRWPALAQIADIAIRYELDVVNCQYQAAAYHMRSPAINMLPWRLKGVAKTAVTFHDLRVPYLFPKAGRLRETAVSGMARAASGAITTNQADFESLKQRVGADTQLAQIPIGSNIPVCVVSDETVSAVRQQLGVGAKNKLLGYFGFVHESKGADLLLQAMAQIDSSTHLVFIGGQTGSSDSDNNRTFEQALRRSIDQLGLSQRVHWTGFVSEHEVSAHLQAVDLMVMPYRDGASLRRGTLMAALAHGRPLLTTVPSGPASELCHGENVFFAEPGESSGLVDAISVLLADAGLRAKLGREALLTAESFSWDKIAARTVEFFKGLERRKGK